jgi:hypothetical protein
MGELGSPVTDGVPGIYDNGGFGGSGVDSGWPGGGSGDVFANPGDFGQTYDPTGGGYGDVFGGYSPMNDSGGFTDAGGWSGGEFGNNTYDPSANPAPSDWPTYQPEQWPTDSGGSSAGGNDVWSSGSGNDYSGGNGGFGQDYSQDNYGYAQGGAIPASMSPSGGQQTDDVQAQGPGNRPLNLNANEFVIPQDVALWKGQEFFQNLIDQSRKRSMTASAKPQPMPANKMR